MKFIKLTQLIVGATFVRADYINYIEPDSDGSILVMHGCSTLAVSETPEQVLAKLGIQVEKL